MNINKAKAVFAIGIMTIVAGSSVTLWQLNENGIIGAEKTTSVVSQQENAEENDIPENEEQQNEDVQENVTEDAEMEEENNEAINENEINDFLTTFSKVYFSENRAFDVNKYNAYDLILFAFSHLRCTDASQIALEQRDDSIMYYNKVSAEKVNEILDEYFGVRVPEESVYTENNYSFFNYSDGYFYTPAADGLAYVNKAVVRSAEKSGNYIIAEFAVYSGDVQYASGEAKIRQEKDGFKLVYYSVNKD